MSNLTHIFQMSWNHQPDNDRDIHQNILGDKAVNDQVMSGCGKWNHLDSTEKSQCITFTIDGPWQIKWWTLNKVIVLFNGSRWGYTPGIWIPQIAIFWRSHFFSSHHFWYLHWILEVYHQYMLSQAAGSGHPALMGSILSKQARWSGWDNCLGFLARYLGLIGGFINVMSPNLGRPTYPP